jgi:hypothetical protein
VEVAARVVTVKGVVAAMGAIEAAALVTIAVMGTAVVGVMVTGTMGALVAVTS